MDALFLSKDQMANEKVECFFKIEYGNQNKSSNPHHFKDGGLTVDEKIIFNFENHEKNKLDITFWYTENDNAYVLIGKGDVSVDEIDKLKENTLETQISLMKESKESAFCRLKVKKIFD